MKTHSYSGQYLKARKRAGGVAWYFIPKDPPQAFLERYGAAVRVPKHDLRVGGEEERAHALLAAGKLWADLQKLKAAPIEGGQWPYGSLRWLTSSWRKSAWFCEEIAPDTRRGYESCLRQIDTWADEVADKRGRHPHVREMTVKGLSSFLERYKDKPTRRQHLRAVLRNLFTHAIQLGLIEQNPIAEVRLSRASRERARPTVLWDQTFVDRFCAEADARGRPEAAGLVRLMWDIGQRPTDLYQLTALNDLERAQMLRGRLPASLYYDPVDEAVRGWQSKTGAFVAIPLDDATTALLRRLRPLPGENRRHLFLNPHTGEPFTPNQFDHLFKRIVKAIEAEDTRFGHGRHSCIVRLYRAGCTDAEVTAITGHASPQTTKSKYWVADDLQAAAAKRRREQFEARK